MSGDARNIASCTDKLRRAAARGSDAGVVATTVAVALQHLPSVAVDAAESCETALGLVRLEHCFFFVAEFIEM